MNELMLEDYIFFQLKFYSTLTKEEIELNKRQLEALFKQNKMVNVKDENNFGKAVLHRLME